MSEAQIQGKIVLWVHTRLGRPGYIPFHREYTEIEPDTETESQRPIIVIRNKLTIAEECNPVNFIPGVVFLFRDPLTERIPGGAGIREEDAAYIPEIDGQRPTEHEVLYERITELEIAQQVSRTNPVVISDAAQRRYEP